MKNRRAILAGCAAAATLTVLPGLSALVGAATNSAADTHWLAAFKRLQGVRIPLLEGGSVVVAGVDSVGRDPRWEQCLVQVVPSAPMDSGNYQLQTASGPWPVFLQAGGGRHSTDAHRGLQPLAGLSEPRSSVTAAKAAVASRRAG